MLNFINQSRIQKVDVKKQQRKEKKKKRWTQNKLAKMSVYVYQ